MSANGVSELSKIAAAVARIEDRQNAEQVQSVRRDSEIRELRGEVKEIAVRVGIVETRPPADQTAAKLASIFVEEQQLRTAARRASLADDERERSEDAEFRAHRRALVLSWARRIGGGLAPLLAYLVARWMGAPLP